MAEITWTAEAEIWLRDIFDYIAADNPVAAGGVITGILDRVNILRDFPESGHKHKSLPEGEVRILLYGHYRIAYLLKPTKLIDILGVFHGAMEIDRYLK